METSVKSELQAFVDYFGLGISKEKLISKAYYELERNGHSCYVLNGRYIGIDGEEFQLIKSVKEGRWIAKEIR